MTFRHITDIAESTPTKIVLTVVDGLGGLLHPKYGKSELEAANLPNLRALASESVLGLTDPVAPGVTPGSGPGHLALFGYDPQEYPIKRGVMEALGIGLTLKPGEVATRGNFCTIDSKGNVTDRRAGRIPSEEAAPLVAKLNEITVDGAEVSVYPVKEHRIVVIFKGKGLDDEVTETDPQKTGVPPLEVRPLRPQAEKMARIANQFSAKAKRVLAGQPRGNMALLRGFSQLPHVPSMAERYKLKAAAIAAYPMYRGLSMIVGMRIIVTGATFADECETLAKHWQEHDFFYIHFKPADAAGEDGDF
ncbi:MAG: phosphoglycerate mutase, partial [Chloroflexi bacterium]|nr:phosphoglycerate mutase [Chloroflexota bacterium]